MEQIKVDTINKTKIKTIIKTLILSHPERDWTANALSEFINSHDFRISIEVNPNILGQLLRQERKDSTSYLYGIKKIRKSNKNVYILEE